jgi:hypothetical protein
VKLEAAEADVLALEARAFAAALPDAGAAARFLSLADAAAAGEIPEALLPALETMLELLFQRGRPANRAVLQTVYGKTPRGKQQSAAAREVNAALKTLRGQTLAEVRISAAPGGHSLVVETERVRLTLELDSQGARVASLETG